MPGEPKNGMPCAEFEALLIEALDETLSGERLEHFQAHAHVCPVCGPLFAEADAGRRWLKSLEDVDPPVNLVHNILVATSGVETRRLQAIHPVQPSWWERFTKSVLAPAFAVARQPRFALSFGMAFFSVSVAFSISGVNLTDIRHADLRPSAIKRSYYEASGRVVKYYENIRFVYEIESRVQQFKRATTPAEPGPQEENKPQKENNNNTSGQPEQRQERNYSRWEGQPVLASLHEDLPVVTLATYRRFA